VRPAEAWFPAARAGRSAAGDFEALVGTRRCRDGSVRRDHATAAAELDRALDAGRSVIAVAVDETEAFRARELLDEETRSLETLVLPPEPARRSLMLHTDVPRKARGWSGGEQRTGRAFAEARTAEEATHEH